VAANADNGSLGKEGRVSASPCYLADPTGRAAVQLSSSWTRYPNRSCQIWILWSWGDVGADNRETGRGIWEEVHREEAE
jgi:hypothetical protein